MRDIKIALIILVISLFAFVFENTLIAFPIIYFMGAVMLVIYKRLYVYLSVFMSAFIIDSLRVENFGYTPIFLIATISVIMLYEKYSGSKDLLVALVIIGLVGFIYTHFMFYSIFLTLLFYSLILFFYAGVNFINNKKIYI